jgi:HEAT repeat protein
LPLVLSALAPDTEARLPIDVPGMMKRIALLGERGSALAPVIAEYVFAQHDVDAESVMALIAIGQDDPAAQRVLVAIQGQAGAGLASAHEYFESRADAQQIFLAALDDDSTRVRLAAVNRLSMQGWASREALLSSVLWCLCEADPDWASSAHYWVSSLASRADEVVPTLESMLRSHDETKVVAAARVLHGLASVTDHRYDVSAPLQDSLRHDNVKVRRIVVDALRSYRPAASVPLLLLALRDDDGAVRERAADVLGTLGQHNEIARAALAQAANDEDPDVAAMAEAWLEEIADLAAKAATRRGTGHK